ncbi:MULTISPECIES: LacI family DNA-binding transcriptional regulator [Chryseobacterium]|uniref:LacI family transcriptional regulator n=1 Tax=Chryseobacterium gambrini TaxID=373672 RepID=A0A1N7KJH4_9FLAO|nr:MULTISPECIES: LacI family DNA-binding transcriptional regulator [Chryseobacterium]MCY1661702.1 LacI family DNA-binding transcriptional regulator [Chryseobacterium sp. SL1]BEV02972.1 LacI family transcriptional regulator [Chryseobacterium gambrini]SIS61771.1 transcriptional regulator, LacI family [Chryseobacterium gambrini]
MKRASIKDIARIAEVSVATVSYVLNKKEGSRISEATKTRILDVAKSINYTPNKIAKSLKMNKTKLIGLIVADISNDFYSNIARNIEDEAMKLGYTLLIGSCDENPEKFKKLTELFSEQQVDGMIIAPVVDSDEAINKLIQEEYPIVTIDRYLKNVSLPGVMINNSEISEHICDHLVKKDFDEIIYVGYDTELPHLLDRQDGFDKRIGESDISAKRILIGIHNITEEVHQKMQENLDLSKKTAIYFSSNKLGIAGLRYLIDHNISVPEQVSLVAFDETEAYYLFPTEVSFVQQPLYDMARESVKLLDNQINNYTTNGKRVTFHAKFMERSSVK